MADQDAISEDDEVPAWSPEGPEPADQPDEAGTATGGEDRPEYLATEHPAPDERREPRLQDSDGVGLDLGEPAADQATKPKDGKAKAGDGKAKEKVEAEQVTQLTFHFYDKVNAEGGAFGVADGRERRDGGRRRMTGKISEAEIQGLIDRYAKPACYDDARTKLNLHRIVIIEGRSGTGRRAGAVNLLRGVTGGTLVVLSPALSLRELAEREYTAGYGYLVIDRARDQSTTDLEFTWSSVSEQVREAKAFLVITSTFVGSTVTSAVVPHVTWEHPPVGEVLRARLRDLPELESVLPELLAELPADCPPARLAALAGMVAEGVGPAEALKRLDENAGRDVKEWFADKPSHRAIVEAAALCFLEGTDVRTFETLLRDLHESMARHVSGKKAKSAVSGRDIEVFGEREARTEGNRLLDVRDIATPDAGTVRIVVFKDEAYRRYVLEELWRSRAVPFWDAIREWLAVAVGVSGDNTIVANGLASLACVSFNEVERSYLTPWAKGLIGWPGKITATYVLWYMCRHEGLASVAMQTAVRWARDRNVNLQWTAAVAFGGELGACFPSDAANRLWQLISQKTELWPTGCTALACLFATLSDGDEADPGSVLNLLDIKMKTFGTGTGSGRNPMPAKQLQRLRTLTMTACLAVFSVNSFRNRRPAVFDHLDAHPERTAVIARLWAGLIVFRPLRWETFKALRRGLHALRDISSDPAATARSFGRALSDALPPHERMPFKTEFMQADRLLRRGQKDSPSEVVLACLEAIAVKNQPGGKQ